MIFNIHVDISRSPHDVDIYTGALAEYPVKGGIIGPLLTCLIGDQYVRLKKGDSYWYERTRGPQRFSKGLKFIVSIYLNQILKISISIHRSTKPNL